MLAISSLLRNAAETSDPTRGGLRGMAPREGVLLSGRLPSSLERPIRPT